MSKWGKDSRSRNRINHKLGSHGYLGKTGRSRPIGAACRPT
jgi:hypothetical protein